MRFIPNFSLQIIREEDFPDAIADIAQKLAHCRQEGYFTSFDGKPMYYEYFLAQNSTASVVIIHGLSEFTKKFYEAAWYFLNQGYNVFLYDQRCHGQSCRLTEQRDLIHVDSFNDYAKDLSIFIDTVVLPAEEKPLYLYSHSMGGAVTLLYLKSHSDMVTKAVLSAPLFAPKTVDLPEFMVTAAIRACKWFRGGKNRFFFGRDFDPDHPFERSADKSLNRFSYYLGLRRNNPCYQTSPMTNGWINASTKLKHKLLSRRFIQSITTPILLLSAEADTVVKTKYHYAFAEKCKNCTLVTIKDGNHGMLVGTPETITEHVTTTLAFYRD